MCTPDIFLGVLAILFPPLPGIHFPAFSYPSDMDDSILTRASLGKMRHLFR